MSVAKDSNRIAVTMKGLCKLSIEHWLFVGFIVIGIVASIMALYPLKSLLKFGPYIFSFFIYYKISTGTWQKDKLVKFLQILLALAFVICIHGIFEYVWKLSHGVSDLGLRITSFTTHPNSLAKWLLPLVPVSLTFTIISRNPRYKLLYGLASFCMVLIIGLTLSRGAWIALFAGFVLLALLFRNYRLLSTMGVLVAVTIFLLPPEIGLQRLMSIVNPYHAWNVERLNVWLATFAIIKDHPFFGVGLNNFQFYYLDYKPVAGAEIFRHAHNTFLNIAVEMGVLGLVLFLLFLGIVLRKIFQPGVPDEEARIGRSLAIGLISLLVFGMVEYIFNNEAQIVMFFVQLAVAGQLVRDSVRSSGDAIYIR